MATNTLEEALPTFELVQRNQPLHDSVRQALENYLAKAPEPLPDNLYDMLLAEIEIPLLQAVMAYCRNNQSRASMLLGLSRGTLRKKLRLYGLLKE